MKNQKERTTNLICPITGSELIYIGHDEHVMDPDSYYSPKSDRTIIFACHPFCRNLYRLIDSKSMHANELRYFNLNADNSWTELKKIPYTDELVELDYPEDKFNEQMAAGKLRHDEAQEYRRNHPKEFPQVRTIAADLVDICPMPAPIGIVNYIDFKYPSQNIKGGFIINLIRKIKNIF